MQILHRLTPMTPSAKKSYFQPHKTLGFSLLLSLYSIFRIGISCTRRKQHLSHMVGPAHINYFTTQYVTKDYETARFIPPHFYILCGIMATYMFSHRCEYFINWLLLLSENLLPGEQAEDYGWQYKVTYSKHCNYKKYRHHVLLSCGLCKQITIHLDLLFFQNEKVWISPM